MLGEPTNGKEDSNVITTEVVVIGGGIAGISAAYFLADAGAAVIVMEAEASLAHHTTGRSAAHYLENYGNDTVRALTIAGRSFFAEPPPHLAETALWSSVPMLRVGSGDHGLSLPTEAEAAQALVPSTRFLTPEEACNLFPPLRREVTTGALLEPEAMELDVAGLHQLFVRGVRAAGGDIRTSSPVQDLTRVGGGWRVTTPSGVIDCGHIINAAGAWGDRVAALADLIPIGLHPLRRTVAVVSVPGGTEVDGWPLVAFESSSTMDAYCKPEPGGLLPSPADETPSEPCDARPEEIDIAIALDRLAEWTTLDVRHVRSSWAGLRTFTADRTPVAGFDPADPTFFWLVGQGGYGIQTAPGLGRVTASLVLDGVLPAELSDRGLTTADLAADRPGLSGELIPGH